MEECVGKKIAEIICRAWNSLDASLIDKYVIVLDQCGNTAALG